MIEWVPTDSRLVENVAEPLLKVPVPIVAVPSLKVTPPLGTPDPGKFAETAAVKVTVWPETEGLAAELSTVVVAALLTVCENVPELVLNEPSPL